MEFCNIEISNEFSAEEINTTAKSNRLLTIEIEPSMKCNYKCSYCYAAHEKPPKNELSLDEVKNIIIQAKDLGAKKIIILGGEPTIYKHFRTVIEFISGLGLQSEIFTNGSTITEDLAGFLFKNRVRVVIKLNSLNPEIMAELTNRKDSLDKALNSLKLLKEAGYGKDLLLGASTVICQYNYDEILHLWQWLKDQDIAPYFEMITPQGRAKENDGISLPTEKVEELFNKIAELDYKLYGEKWDIQPPLIGGKCLRNLYSCVVDSTGNVKPCVGVNINCGNIRKNTLQEIIQESGVIQDLRNYKEKLRGPCRSCDHLKECYGCRGAAYQLTGEPLASDPLCWRNKDKLDQIYSLPYPAADIIPQQGKMQMVDTLVRLGDKKGYVEAEIKSGSPFVDENGVASESIFLELIAQSLAAINGFYALENGITNGMGFIIGAKKIKNYGLVKVGDKLTIEVKRDVDLGDFGIVYGKVFHNDKLIAEGELKVFGKSY